MRKIQHDSYSQGYYCQSKSSRHTHQHLNSTEKTAHITMMLLAQHFVSSLVFGLNVKNMLCYCTFTTKWASVAVGTQTTVAADFIIARGAVLTSRCVLCTLINVCNQDITQNIKTASQITQLSMYFIHWKFEMVAFSVTRSIFARNNNYVTNMQNILCICYNELVQYVRVYMYTNFHILPNTFLVKS